MAEVVDMAGMRPTLAVATVGHYRSGKTTLTAALHNLHAGREPALTPVELDRRSGSPPLGIADGAVRYLGRPHDGPGAIEPFTVRSTKIAVDAPARRFVHIDCPGYRCWYKNAARGQAVADALILVIAAPEGVQAQTREHLLLARALGIRDLVVFVNKCDLIGDLEWLDLVERDVRDLLEEVGFDGDHTRILRGAAGPALAGEGVWAASLRDLVDALEADVPLPPPPEPGPPLLYVDQVHESPRHGLRVIVQGRVRRGSIRRGDTLALVGPIDPYEVRVDNIEVFHQRVEVARAGDQVGLLLARPDEKSGGVAVASGYALVGGDAAATRGLRVRLRILRAEEGGRHTAIHNGHLAQLFFGAAVTVGSIEGLHAPLWPGEEGEVLLRLRRPLYLEPGMPVIVRDGAQGHQRLHGGPALWSGTAGFGTILAVGAI